MPRDSIALTINDLSAFARTLRRDLATADSFPGHLALMNMLARAAGYGNFQHLRASGGPTAAATPAPLPEAERKHLDAALRVFDAEGRMTLQNNGKILHRGGTLGSASQGITLGSGTGRISVAGGVTVAGPSTSSILMRRFSIHCL